MSMHLSEAVHDADVRSDPLFIVDPASIESPPPSLQRVLLAAATLWCRTLTWPTVREISTTAAVAASTSIRAAGTSERLRELLVESELWTIVELSSDRLEFASTKQEALRWGLTARVRRLGAIDPALARLPLIAGLTIGDEALALDASVAYQRARLEALDSSATAA